MHVDLHAATALRDGPELCLPEIFLAARDPAFFMDAESDTGDRWNFFEQQSQSLPAIGRVCHVGQPFNRVGSLRTPRPLVGQSPDAELKTQPAPGAFLADEFQHGQIAGAFLVGKIFGTDIETGNGHKKRIRKQ